MLRDLVVARIVYPKSKTATIRYLRRYLGITLSKDKIYRFLDTLDKDALTKTAFSFVSQKNNGVSILFYDVTTLHFETETEDDFRKKGFSKNHRTDVPQIMLGLFVDNEGYPFDFDFFEGSIFEGHTFPAAIKKIVTKYAFTSLTIVADAAMLSFDNLKYLDSLNLNYIVGARLKNLPEEVIEEIHSHDFTKKAIFQTTFRDQQLFVDYSSERRQKDTKQRERLVKKLEERLMRKEAVIHKSKYLRWEKQGKIAGIDKKQIEADKKFDGLKGYITNNSIHLKADEIIKQYHNLWKVEKAFRMSKSDLKERPIYHQHPSRIKSHLLICFVSLLIMRETENILNKKQYSLVKHMHM
jgi:transposase